MTILILTLKEREIMRYKFYCLLIKILKAFGKKEKAGEE